LKDKLGDRKLHFTGAEYKRAMSPKYGSRWASVLSDQELIKIPEKKSFLQGRQRGSHVVKQKQPSNTHGGRAKWSGCDVR
jgi:hypothetical protein